MDVGNANVRGEQYKEQPNQQDAELILEFAQVAIDVAAKVSNHDARDGHCENAAVGDQEIAHHEQRQHRGKRDDVFVALGHELTNTQQASEN